MHRLTRKWKLYVIHHSHTDIGYTDRQEKIERYHVEFIKQAIQISERIRSGERPEWEGFRWTCETFWGVERFLAHTDEDWHQRFEQAVRSGHIEITGNYLNMTELIDDQILRIMLQKAADLCQSLHIPLNSAMTADINGYSWGYAQCLFDTGISNLFSCVHATHGLFPIGRKQIPFYWETQRGDRLLVWSSDHYNLGNFLGLAPKGLTDFVGDKLSSRPIEPNHQGIARERIIRYLAQLEKEQYPYDFVPVAVSGLLTDNAPPNYEIMNFIRQFHVDQNQVLIEMSTLHDFFAMLRRQSQEIPIYKGDWPDWWSDGIASTATTTALFRDAQRNLRFLKRLDRDSNIADKAEISQAEYQLMMYAEHTWGYSASVSEPWNPLVQSLELRKGAYAVNAHRIISNAVDKVMATLGEAPLAINRPFSYKVLNPHPFVLEGLARFYIDVWETPLLEQGIELIDTKTGLRIAHQMDIASRGMMVCAWVRLEPDEEKLYSIQPTSISSTTTTTSFPAYGTSSIRDVKLTHPFPLPSTDKNQIEMNGSSIESPYVRIKWEAGQGITSWMDKTSGKELICSDRQFYPFSPVYERSPIDRLEDMVSKRFQMGRNRKGMNVIRHVGKLVQAGPVRRTSSYGGPDAQLLNHAGQAQLFESVELMYEVEGMSFYTVILTVYVDSPRVDATVRIHKDSNWEPENVYIALPFCTGETGRDELWIEKTGTVLRPWHDQLPATGIDYYCIQEGILLKNRNQRLVIAMPDTPVIQTGPLAYQDRVLYGHPGIIEQSIQLFSWALNNFWATNFKATIGGFYEFRYSIQWGNDCSSAEQGVQVCHALNHGIPSVRIGS